MKAQPLPWQEIAPLAHIFGLTGQECSLTCYKLKFRENTGLVDDRENYKIIIIIINNLLILLFNNIIIVIIYNKVAFYQIP